MQVKINRPVILGGKTYRPGVHDVPDGDLRGWFAEALLASGAIVPAETPQSAPETQEATPAAPEAEKPRKRAKKAD